MLTPLTAACLAAAAYAYQIPTGYLYSILAVEGGRVGEASASKNGSRDLGPFQVNSSWGPAVSALWHVPVDQALNRLRDDGCANAIVATAILRRCADEAGGNIEVAVGLYHSHSAVLAERYRTKVLSIVRPAATGSRPMIKQGLDDLRKSGWTDLSASDAATRLEVRSRSALGPILSDRRSANRRS